MQDYEKQFRRVERFLKKITDNRNRIFEEYEDDFWAFFQNCWHLKDWVLNDPSIPQVQKDAIVFSAQNTSYNLMICGDLCNRSKHLSLRTDSKRVDADLSSRGLRVHAGIVVVNKDGTQKSEGGYGELEFIISDATNHQYRAIDVARQSVDEWRSLLIAHGLKV